MPLLYDLFEYSYLFGRSLIAKRDILSYLEQSIFIFSYTFTFDMHAHQVEINML